MTQRGQWIFPFCAGISFGLTCIPAWWQRGIASPVIFASSDVTSGQSAVHATAMIARKETRLRRECISRNSSVVSRCAPSTVMRYEEFPPPAALAPFVRCAWRFEASPDEAAAVPQRIVPDGRCELVVHLGE